MRRPWLTIAVAFVLALLGLWNTVARFAINTDTASLISPEVEWRRLEMDFDRSFPQRTEQIAVVIDARTAEGAEAAAERLATALRDQPNWFRSVERPDGGPFFARHGLLLLPLPELQETLGVLAEQAGLLSILASDPTLRGFAQTIGATLVGIRTGAISLEQLGPRYDRFAEAIEAALAGRKEPLSWRALLDNRPPSTADLRRIVLVRPVVDYEALQPGAEATEILRDAAGKLGLLPSNGVTVRLTGSVPLADEEFATVAENMALNVSATLLAIAVILLAALRSPKLIGAVLLTLLAGLVVTSGLGLAIVGRLNLISVAFFILFIGLGVDFGIQFAVRYRADRYGQDDISGALRSAARGVGFSLTLAALSLAAGFLSFLPTEFQGVSELGLIAGVGMLVACLASFTLLPALIAVFRPAREPHPVETASLAAIDHWIARHRRLVLVVTGVVVATSVPALLALRFDSDPMDLRDKRVESVATYRDLASHPDTSPHSIQVLAPSLEAVQALAARLEKLPEVLRVVSLATFLPADQEDKLAAIRATETALSSVLDARRIDAPEPEEAATALRQTSAGLRRAAGPSVASATRLADALDRLAAAPGNVQVEALRALTVNFDRLVADLRTSLNAEQITRDTLPPELVADWMDADGRARLEVIPKGDASDPAVGSRFVAAVRSVAPNASGAPVTIAESGRTIVRAFTEAGIYSLVAITLILWVAMRRLKDVALALGPLILAGILTLGAARLVGLNLNFANIIALPLMFGVGVAFHIYYLIAWRAGVADVLASSLTRAVFFSALTTGVAFGSLWASSHPGTASMGELLAIALVFTLLAAFLVVPAFLGPPKATAEQP